MSFCRTCGNSYDRGFDIIMGGETYSFDSFECAIHKLAPICEGCGLRILGHGVESDQRMFCSSHCARSRGVQGIRTHVDTTAAV